MSFWSSAVCYFPGLPPRVTCGQIADLIDELASLGLDARLATGAKVMFGEPIDRDDLGLMDEIVTEYKGVIFTQFRDRRYDVEFEARTPLAEIAEGFRAHRDRPVYRCFIALGDLPSEAVERLHVRSPLNECVICPHAVSLSIEPVTIGTLRDGESWLVSYLALSVGGSGYCFPRTVEQVVNAIRHDPAVLPLADALARHWPSRQSDLTGLSPKYREILGVDWAYPEGEPRSPDWVWAMSETG